MDKDYPPHSETRQLLPACYGEVLDEALVDEARSIIASWSVASLTAEQQEAVDEFQNVVPKLYKVVVKR